MRRPAAWVLATLVVLGCSKLPTTGNGIVAIEVDLPASTTLHQGDSITLQARALDQSGNQVATDSLFWFTVDTAAVSVDSVRGVVVGRVAGGSARIQAVVGTLRSSPLTLLLSPPTVTPSSPDLPQEP